MSANLPESFQMIFQDSPIGVAVVMGTTDGTLDNAFMLYANPSLLRILGNKTTDRFDLITPLKEICSVGHAGESLLPLPQNPRDMRTLVSHFTSIHNADDHFWLEVRAQPTNLLGEGAHILWFTDVSDAKNREFIAQKQARIADQAAQAKSNFLATMSHEIRTPLQTIFGMLELLTEENPAPHLQEMINSAKKSANNLLGILDDILDLAKVEAGKMALDIFEVPVRTLAFGIAEALSVKKRSSALELNVDVAYSVPTVVMGDPKRLRQILVNLLGNSLKFTETGHVTLRVSTQGQHIMPTENEAGEEGLVLRFEIEDTGIGMSPEVASKLFQPFTQADNSTTRKFGGTGLGLSIAHRLVDLMHGQIGVISEEGKGSTFWFEIPTFEATDEGLDLPELDGLTVLSVEDHPRGAKEIEGSLASMGAKVTSVASCAEAIKLVTQTPFDVVVVDNGLPDGEGVHLLRDLNRLRPFMGLILYTVYDDYAVQQICKSVGADYLGKPASRIGLGEAVKGAAKQTTKISFDTPKRLLICEDTESVRDILRRQLKVIGIDADFAENGQLGWEIIQRGEHGLVITDLHMPEMDGYGLINAVRESNEETGQHLPVVAMTADVQLAHHQAYLKYGFDECLLKPVSLGQMRQLFVRWGLLQEQTEQVNIVPETPTFEATTTMPTNTNTEPTTLPTDGKPIIDPVMAIDQLGAFDADALEMVQMFVNMTQTQIADIKQAFADMDWLKLKLAAHSLKGGARSACCPRLGDVAEKLQHDAERQGVDAALVQQALQEFDFVERHLAELMTKG